MHSPFDPKQVNWINLVVSANNNDNESLMMQGRGSFQFRGMPYQRGAGIGSIFRSLWRFLLPIGRKAGEAIGRQGLESGVHILSDVLEGRNPREAAIDHGRVGARKLLDKASAHLGRQQRGSGFAGNQKNSINKNARVARFTSALAEPSLQTAITTTTKSRRIKPSLKTARRRRTIRKSSTTKRINRRGRQRKSTAKGRRKRTTGRKIRRDALGFF